MIILTNLAGRSIALNPLYIEAVAPDPDDESRSWVVMTSGRDYHVQHSRATILRMMVQTGSGAQAA